MVRAKDVAPEVPEREGGNRERTRVEGLLNRGIGHSRVADKVRPRVVPPTDRIADVADVSNHRHIVGLARPRRKDGVRLPAAQYPGSGSALQPSLTLAERQFIDSARGQIMGHVEAGNAPARFRMGGILEGGTRCADAVFRPEPAASAVVERLGEGVADQELKTLGESALR